MRADSRSLQGGPSTVALWIRPYWNRRKPEQTIYRIRGSGWSTHAVRLFLTTPAHLCQQARALKQSSFQNQRRPLWTEETSSHLFQIIALVVMVIRGTGDSACHTVFVVLAHLYNFVTLTYCDSLLDLALPCITHFPLTLFYWFILRVLYFVQLLPLDYPEHVC